MIIERDSDRGKRERKKQQSIGAKVKRSEWKHNKPHTKQSNNSANGYFR